MEILLVALNYVVRGMTIVIGVLLLVNYFRLPEEHVDFVRIFGAITVVFGIFRTYTYYRHRVKIRREQEEFSNENDNV